MSDAGGDSPAWAARKLLREALGGVLSTSAEGQPFASLVTPCLAPDGSVLMLLSDLSEHTRHLRMEPRCAVLVHGEKDGLNPQTAPRVTVTGLAEIEGDPLLKARWVTRHPYAAFYADFGDFNLWRMRVVAGLYVGGFARAHRLRGAELLPDVGAVGVVGAAEMDILEHCNSDHSDALDVIGKAHGLPGAGWVMTACDVDGFDLGREDEVRRIAWPAPVDGAGAIRAALVGMARSARADV